MKALHVAVATMMLGGALGASAPAQAACPDTLCECLGEAGKFETLATDKLTIGFGKISYSGSSYKIPAEVLGDVCGLSAIVGGDAEEAFTSVGNVAVRATTGTLGVKFKAVKIYGILDPGSEVDGDVATAGGSILNQQLAIINGTTDDTGTHPLISRCTQGATDVISASATLGALPPTQTHERLLSKGGEEEPLVITAGPGLNVINATIEVGVVPLKVYGYPEPSEIIIDMDPATTLVVINTPKLKVGKQCIISVDGAGADPSKVVINVTSLKGVKISQEADLQPVLLAPQSNVTVGQAATSSSVYGRKVTVKGAELGGVATCSPSGAFLDGGAAF